MRYLAYGLSVHSDLALPELITQPDGVDRSADVHFQVANIPTEGLPEGQQIGPFAWAAPQTLWLEVPGVARFLVRDGRSIQIDPAGSVADDRLRLFLLGAPLAALLLQRRHLVLQGSAAHTENRAVVCIGPSGTGKSALTAGMMGKGIGLLSDGIVAVDAEGRACAGAPRIKLWHDMVREMNVDPAGLQRLRPDLESFAYPAEPDFDAEARVAVRWVYVIVNGHRSEIQIEPIQDRERFVALHDDTYRAPFLKPMAVQFDHLKLCGALAGNVHMARVTRPKRGCTIELLTERVMADMADNS